MCRQQPRDVAESALHWPPDFDDVPAEQGETGMRRSTDRILTTHVGSLPRPPDLIDLIVKELHGEQVDPAIMEPRVRRAVQDVVDRQTDIGIDIVSDGEAG